MKKEFVFKSLLILFSVIVLSFTTNVYAFDIYDMDDLHTILTDATINGSKITLDKNYDLGYANLVFESGTYEIDLNGFNITSGANYTIEAYGGNITISNSSTTLGSIYNTCFENYNAPIYVDDATFIINNGIIGSPNNPVDIGIYVDDGDVTINNGEFYGLRRGLYMNWGTVTIKDGIFKATTPTEPNDGITIYGGDVTIDGGSFISSDLNNDGWGLFADNADDDVNIVINNGTFTGSTIGAELYDYDYGYDISLTINGGTFIGKNSGLIIYDTALDQTKITSGVFKAISEIANERYGGLAIGYETTLPTIDDLDKENSIMIPNDTSASSYTYQNDEYLILKTANEVIIGVPKTITISNMLHGSITANKLLAVPGEEITLTITPEENYLLKKIEILDSDGLNPVTVTNKKFIMPQYNVNITAEFEEEIDYIYTQGANQKLSKNSKNDLNFTINADYELLDKVYVDNDLLSENDYSSSSGSTIITLKNSYLSTLTAKEHTLKVTFTNGKESITKFTIESETNPNTGDRFMNYIIIGSISLIGTLSIYIFLKKKNKIKN